MYTPFLSGVIGTRPAQLTHWAAAGVAALVLAGVIDLEKGWRRRRGLRAADPSSTPPSCPTRAGD
jgi:hypothetical protein